MSEAKQVVNFMCVWILEGEGGGEGEWEVTVFQDRAKGFLSVSNKPCMFYGSTC